MKGANADPTRQMIAEEAARWICDMRETHSADQEALLAWLKLSPLHVEEFLLASAVWKEMDHVGPTDAQGIERVVAEARSSVAGAQVIALRQKKYPDSTPAARLHGKTPYFVAAASVLMMVLTAWLYLANSNTYGTEVGEQRIVRLDDGSVVQLNTHTRITVSFRKHTREIRLLEGEALFKVAHDTTRPFKVIAGDAVVVALGTQFNVYRRGDAVTVSVVEGTVAVAGQSDPPLAKPTVETQQRLSAGEQASVESSGEVRKRTEPDLAQAMAWRERRLVFQGETLEEVAAQFNRYTTRTIRVESATARNTRLAGTFSADDPDSLVLFLDQYRDLVVEKDGAGFVIRDR